MYILFYVWYKFSWKIFNRKISENLTLHIFFIVQSHYLATKLGCVIVEFICMKN